MAKNTGASKFRRVDVDQFDDDKFVDDADTEAESAEGANDAEVNNLLAQGKSQDALKLVLTSAPVGSKSQAVKDRAFNTALRVLTSFKSADIDKSVKALDPRSIDTLMKYIYRGFETPSDNSSALLLTWHEKTFVAGGLGSIVRVLTDRKRV
ncbi:actin-related protein 2/3 complex subunit 5-B-like [Littorina saxatilis]|uniref:Actin-related protein 2/3 complex subunit 5 n=1 Tax=Littorina saxatilis TaxID=31220 RepID=A0AAN9AXF2_9CAEN|eukprot:GHVL01003315.1.p1 GENE.GHVL01003315.1~~GHVL01003315.1.p1  ORF type:complete len:152 (+),score=24.28 GHVL01003315.1:22-477(+)